MSDQVNRTLRDHTGRQLSLLCEELSLDGSIAGYVRLLHELLGTAGSRSVAEPAPWPSFIVDDHTPVEFSLAFEQDQPPTLRVLVEHLAPRPCARDNQRAARRLTDRLAQRYPLSLDRLDAVADLFLPDQPQGLFSLWHAVGLHPAGRYEFKVYLNPAVRGMARAPALVAQALHRLGLPRAYDTMLGNAFRPGADADRFTFFSLDLHSGPSSRVKVYLTHDQAGAVEIERAAGAVPGTQPEAVREFCRLAGGSPGPFSRRPLVSCYAFVGGSGAVPSSYTLHLPIRDYVADDQEARDRVALLLEQTGSDSGLLDRALKCIAGRSLNAGAGLITYVSLRMGPVRPGITVYLSSEAYGRAPAGISRSAGDWS